MTRTSARDAAKEIEMTTHYRSLMFVAAVAILPVACGTSSPMGTDLAALEAPTQVTSFRSDPTAPVPPQAPDSPESDPVPAPAPNDHQDPAPDPKDPKADPTAIELPTNAPQLPTNAPPMPTNEQAPPSGPETDPLPSPAPPNAPPLPTNDQVPPSGAEIDPLPSPVPPTNQGECQVASIEIKAMGKAILEPAGDGFEAILTDKSGSLIEDGSCEKLVWAAEGARGQTRTVVVIHYESDSRFVYVQGMSGNYKVGVTAPNGVSASIGFEVK
jgi:hypothetical protein